MNISTDPTSIMQVFCYVHQVMLPVTWLDPVKFSLLWTPQSTQKTPRKVFPLWMCWLPAPNYKRFLIEFRLLYLRPLLLEIFRRLKTNLENYSLFRMDRIFKVLNFSLRNLGESIQAICKHVVKHYHDLHDWLFAVPLVHFLTQASKPFSTDVLLVEEPKRNDDLWWGASEFSTKPVREANFTDIR